MTLQEFLKEILPTTGTYYTVQLTKGGRASPLRHGNIADAETEIHNITQRQHHAYIAIGSFNGERRTQDNCTYKRAWYVDIDCKEGGQYATKQEAIDALRAAIHAGLPPFSILIDSGNGFHPYWICTEDVPRKDWKAEAKILTKACAATNLKIDSAVTEDEARIMRAPESVNWKDPQHPKKCFVGKDTGIRYTYAEFAEKMDQWRTAAPALSSPSAAAQAMGALVDAADLFGGRDQRDALAMNMIERCAIFNNSWRTHGKDDQEPLWHQIIHTLVYCDDGLQFIHPISDGHPGYSESKTNRKYQWSAKVKDKTGPTTCKKFSELSNACKKCEYNGKVKAPITLAVGEPDPVPFPYRTGGATDRFGNDYANIERYIGEDEGWEEVVPWAITDFNVIEGSGDTPTQVWMKCNGKMIVSELKELTTRDDGIAGALATRGVAIPHDSSRRLLRHLVSIWVDQLQRTKRTNPGADKLGWVGDKFHYDGWLYGKNGEEATRMLDVRIQAVYTPDGTLEPWQACANHILSQPRQASWSIIASAFAAPLLRFTGVSGALLSIVSQDSGTGKSTAMKLAAAVWGDPKSSMASLDDTPNSVAHRLGVLNTLPAYWDEVREKEQVQRFIANVFRLAQGKEKARLNASIQQRKSGEWDTMLIIASNDPLKDHILQTVGNSDAGIARVFELRAEHINADGMSDGEARHFYGQINGNFGHAGAAYAKWLGEHKAEAEKRIKAMDATLSTKLNTKQGERFWVATIASLITGAQIATDLGLCQFNMPELKKYLVGKLLVMRGNKQDEYSTPLERAVYLVGRFLREKNEQTIHSKRMPSRGGRATNAITKEAARHPIVARVGIEDHILRLTIEDFTNWYYNREGSGQSHVIQNLVTAGAKKIRGSVDAGTPGASGRYPCIDIPLKSPAFADLHVEGVTVDNTDLG